ncbi:MAG: DNA repair protein RecO [Bdellovibrionota bacterium]
MKRSGAQQLEALILRQTDYADHDKIIGLYTRSHGKISAFAASAKRSQKRFGSSLDLFSQVSAHLNPPGAEGKTLWRLQSIDLINPNVELRKSLLALAYAGYFADCVWNLLADEDPHEDVFDFLVQSSIELSKPNLRLSELIHMEIELLQLCGYGPRFSECVECNNPIDAPKVFFSFSRGGVVCSSCTRNDQGLWMPTQISKNAQAIESEKDFLAVRSILEKFVTFIVGRELKSQSFRREVHHAVHQ